MLPEFKRLWFLLRRKGFRYTYNYIYFTKLYDTSHPLLIKWLQWLQPYPSFIEVEVTTRCNLRCTICEHTYWSEPNRDMSFEEFKSIVDQFPGLKWIGLTGIGESFLNKDFMKMLKYVKSKGVYVELYDTFYFMDKSTIKELIGLSVDRIYTSLDAATKDTYERIRKGSSFERVMDNLKDFASLKRKMGVYYPELCLHFIVTKENYCEMPQFIELAHSLNTPITHVQFTRMLHEFEEIDELFTEVPDKIIEETNRKANSLGIPIAWNLNVPKSKPSIVRCTAWTMPFIFVTGHVVPCCAGNEANKRDFQKETSFGNVFKKSFKEIWYSKEYKEFRRMIREGKVPIPCKSCPIYAVK